MSPLRILHCLRSPVGGLFRHVRDLASEQARRGYEVGILCDDTATDSLTESRLAELDEAITLGVHRVSMSRGLGLSDFSAFMATRRLLQTLGIDVAHGHGAKGGAHARLAARSLKRAGHSIITTYTPHGGSLNYNPGTAAARVFMGLERQLISATDGLIFESAFAQGRYLEHVGGANIRRQVTFNGLLPEEFEPPVLCDGATDLLFIGELRDIKGVDVLLDAIAQVRQTRPVTATIVGEGRDSVPLQAQAKNLGIEAAVRFVGAKPARDAFTMGRVIVVPSRKESFPYVVLEAAAAGLPLISTNVGGIPEIVSGTDTRLIDCDDVASLASVIHQVLENPEQAAAKAGRLRDRVGSSFTVANMTDEICHLYAECQMAIAA